MNCMLLIMNWYRNKFLRYFMAYSSIEIEKNWKLNSKFVCSMLRLLPLVIGLCADFMSWRLFSTPSIWKILTAAMKVVEDISGWRLFSVFSDGWYPLIFSSRMVLKSSFRIAFMKASSCSLAMSGFGSYAVACRTRTDFLLM